MGLPFNLVDILYGEHGVMYEPGATLSERVWALAETVRLRFEEAGDVVSGQDPFIPEKAKEIVDKRESKIRSGVFIEGVSKNVIH